MRLEEEDWLFYYIGNAFRQIGENIYIRELTLG